LSQFRRSGFSERAVHPSICVCSQGRQLSKRPCHRRARDTENFKGFFSLPGLMYRGRSARIIFIWWGYINTMTSAGLEGVLHLAAAYYQDLASAPKKRYRIFDRTTLWLSLLPPSSLFIYSRAFGSSL
jgi:hypothetical protein